MSDERDQGMAITVAYMMFCLWIGHLVAAWNPHLWGCIDLQPWIVVWNREIWIHWPTASLVLLAGGTTCALVKLRSTRKNSNARRAQYRPIK
jgi:hypothetical protein